MRWMLHISPSDGARTFAHTPARGQSCRVMRSCAHSAAIPVLNAAALYAGVLFGVGFGYAGWLINQQPERGYRFATTVSVLMAGVMGYRFYTTGKVMPAGVMAGLGGASAAYHFLKLKEWTD